MQGNLGLPFGPEGASPSVQGNLEVVPLRIHWRCQGAVTTWGHRPCEGGRDWDTPSLAPPCQSILRRGPPSGHRGARGGWWAARSCDSLTPWVVAGDLSLVLTRLGPLAVREFFLVCFSFGVRSGLSCYFP